MVHKHVCWALVCGLVLLCGACRSAPQRVASPRYPALDVVVVDGRADQPHVYPGYEEIWLYALPLVPYYSWREDYYIERSLHDEICQALVASGCFAQVYGSGDSVEQRALAPLELRVELATTSERTWQVNYAVGLAGFVLHLCGFPVSVERAVFEAELVLVERATGLQRRVAVADSDSEPRWIYAQAIAHERLPKLVREAVWRAVVANLKPDH